MKRILVHIVVIAAVFLPSVLGAEVSVRIKDLVSIEGLRENQVYGYGLVVGLQGSGDSRVELTRTSLKNVLKNLGLEEDITNSKNVAAVLVTAKLPPFTRVGDRVDVTVSSIGDAKTLKGGLLLQSPLRGADNNIYVVAQGQLSSSQSGERRGRNNITVARVVNGGIIERGIEPEIVNNGMISLVMHNWDFTVADQIQKAIEKKYPDAKPAIVNGSIQCTVPGEGTVTEFISTIENLEVPASFQARVVVNEQDGTIVMGGDVRISRVVVSRSGMTVTVEGSPRKGSVALIEDSSTVKNLVDSLNVIGASTTDIIAILKAMKNVGALHAELVIQ